MKGSLAGDQAERERLAAVLKPEKDLTSPDVFRGAAWWYLSQKETPVGRYIVDNLPETPPKAYKNETLKALLEDLRELQSLHLIAGVAVLYEGASHLMEAEQLYQWYLVAEEQAGSGDPGLIQWGVERLAAVWRQRGKDREAAGLEALLPREEEPFADLGESLAGDLEATVVVIEAEAPPAPPPGEPPARFYARLHDELTTLDPGGPDFAGELSAFLDRIPLGPEAWPEVDPKFLKSLVAWVSGLRRFHGEIGDLEGHSVEAVFSLLRDSFPVLPVMESSPAPPSDDAVAVEVAVPELAQAIPPEEGDVEVTLDLEEPPPTTGEVPAVAPGGAESVGIGTVSLDLEDDGLRFRRRSKRTGDVILWTLFFPQYVLDQLKRIQGDIQPGDKLVIRVGPRKSLKEFEPDREALKKVFLENPGLLQGLTIYLQSVNIGMRCRFFTVAGDQGPTLRDDLQMNPDFKPDARPQTSPPPSGRKK